MVRTFIPAALILLCATASIALADGPAMDRVRYDAAQSRATLHWKTYGYDALPLAYDLAAIERDRNTSMVASLAARLIQSNPGKDATVLRYLNGALLPFISAHRAQFKCELSVRYYNTTGIPTAQLADFDESPLSFLFDASYLLLGTEQARRDAALVLPDDDSLLNAISYTRENDPANTTHLYCALGR